MWLIELILETKTRSPHRLFSRLVLFWTRGWTATDGGDFESAEPELEDNIEQIMERVIVHRIDWAAFDSCPDGE